MIEFMYKLFMMVSAIYLIGIMICSIRILIGPSSVDRLVGIDNLTTLMVPCMFFAGIVFGRGVYHDVALLIAATSFIGSIAVSKYLQGKRFEE